MKKLVALFLLILSLYLPIYGQDTRVVLITLDGFRWEELFGGADTTLICLVVLIQH